MCFYQVKFPWKSTIVDRTSRSHLLNRIRKVVAFSKLFAFLLPCTDTWHSLVWQASACCGCQDHRSLYFRYSDKIRWCGGREIDAFCFEWRFWQCRMPSLQEDVRLLGFAPCAILIWISLTVLAPLQTSTSTYLIAGTCIYADQISSLSPPSTVVLVFMG